MSNRYFAWTLLIAACGLQAYLVAQGSKYFIDLETVILPSWLYRVSSNLFHRYMGGPFYIIVILTLALPFLSIIFSWVFLGMKRKSGWTLALVIDLFFGLPSLTLVTLDFINNLRYHHVGLNNNPEVLLLFLALLHILILCSPPIRTLLLSRPPQDSINNLTLPITSP